VKPKNIKKQVRQRPRSQAAQESGVDETVQHAQNIADLTHKIEAARNHSQEAVQLCQQIFLYNGDANRSQHFDDVAGPLVSVIDLLASSLKVLQDILQLEEKFEIDTDTLNNSGLKSQKITIKNCFVKIGDCSKVRENSLTVKSEPVSQTKKKHNIQDDTLDLNEDFTDNFNDEDNTNDFTDNLKNEDKDDTDSYKPREKRAKIAKINYYEKIDDDFTQSRKMDRRKGRKKRFNSNDWTEDEDTEDNAEDRDYELGNRDDTELDNEEMRCIRCDFTTRSKLFYTHHTKGYLYWRQCPWCPRHIKTGVKLKESRDNRYFEEHMRDQHPDLSSASGFSCKVCKHLFKRN
jgi:hypothetical protein